MTIPDLQKFITITLIMLSAILLSINGYVFMRNQEGTFLTGNLSQRVLTVENQSSPRFQSSLTLPQTQGVIEVSLTTFQGDLDVTSQSNSEGASLQTVSDQESEAIILGNDTETLLFSRSNEPNLASSVEKSAQSTISQNQSFVLNAMIIETQAIVDLEDHMASVDMFHHQTNSSTVLKAPKNPKDPFIVEIDSFDSQTTLYLPEGARVSIEGSPRNIYSETPLVQVAPHAMRNTGTSTHLYTVRLNQDSRSNLQILHY